MNYHLCVAVFFTLIIIFLEVHGDGETKQETTKESGIKLGNCNKAVLEDMVLQDNVRKPGLPFIERNATTSWHGDSKIYCIIAKSKKDQNHGTVIIKDGGLNHTFVTFEFHSPVNEGLDYSVQVFGKQVR